MLWYREEYTNIGMSEALRKEHSSKFFHLLVERKSLPMEKSNEFHLEMSEKQIPGIFFSFLTEWCKSTDEEGKIVQVNFSDREPRRVFKIYFAPASILIFLKYVPNYASFQALFRLQMLPCYVVKAHEQIFSTLFFNPETAYKLTVYFPHFFVPTIPFAN